jgi:hypothetical protein
MSDPADSDFGATWCDRVIAEIAKGNATLEEIRSELDSIRSFLIWWICLLPIAGGAIVFFLYIQSRH